MQISYVIQLFHWFLGMWYFAVFFVLFRPSLATGDIFCVATKLSPSETEHCRTQKISPSPAEDYRFDAVVSLERIAFHTITYFSVNRFF